MLAAAEQVAGRSDPALELARGIGSRVPLPGAGHTRARWELLAGLSAVDLTAGRVAEAHLDALAILAEAAAAGPQRSEIGAGSQSTWGVFAAEGSGVTVTARAVGSGWLLSGVKPWCSLADRLDRALITAHVPGGRRLFAVPLRIPSVTVDADSWVSRGLADVPSAPITLDDAPAAAVGETGWYLERPGFAWGGLGVAACWFGGALGLARSLHRTLRRRDCDQIGSLHLGAVDAALFRSRAALDAAAGAVDDGRASGPDGVRWASRVREVVATSAEEILTRVGHALGPAPLALDADHARRVADLTVYLRQHHAERDQAALGRSILDEESPW